MPATSSKQYGFMQRVARGQVHLKSLSPEQAREFIHKTPPEKRRMFAKQTAKRRGTYD